MPTAGRRRFVPQAIACFLAQDYEDRELVVVDDGDAECRDLIPSDPRIRYYSLVSGGQRSIGYLRNCACDLASGRMIAHLDDDDYSAPGRLSEQVLHFRAAGNVDVVGYHSMLFLDIRRRQEHALLRYDATGPGYAIGTSFVYMRSFWQRNNFEDRDLGEDNKFQDCGRVATLSAVEPAIMMVARIHEQTNTGKAALESIRAGVQPCWSVVEDPERLRKVEALFQ